MKTTTVILLCTWAVLAQSMSIKDAEKCSDEKCKIGDNCRCSSTKSPLDGDAPQLITLTFDEAVVNNIFTDVWKPLLFDRKNPDGNPISATFFVPHEYTDYRRVQELYVQGFEIGVNSITKNSTAEYWLKASEDVLREEFEGQRILMSHFANIPIEDIVGARTPQLQLQGDASVNAYVASGVAYDSSWTSRSTSMMFPYTLDYLSTQECRTGTTCPKDPHAGFWVAPIINIQGNSTDGILECNSLNTCNFHGTAEEIAQWLLSQIERERSTTKAPLSLMVPSSWFRFTDNSYEGFKTFLDELAKLNDVFLVSLKQVIDWTKNPVSASDFKTDVPERTADCDNPRNCPLRNTNGDLRYMMSCVECPEVYPWLGNPLGQAETTTPAPTTAEPTTPTPEETTTPEAF
ncbi:chitin deacetylase 6 precursor [Tribolium castaneum]|uniref:Chitin deacetylase 6 n=1 Tax=Tribolium castaneum TaxID=7070 RepID=A8W492_TRICA|nr:chitin deacetylase 6 precursor [Tribolium castaneum]ABW74149.1 chitin deacetylase 6 [Tribolium castaneum]EFA03579.1 hypothetical protein TcasGA2_TC013662 [Tribolium castaneum]|eukprot:NP_001103905.1 chitin deacetylase 6 precursor [Tribolium castaneum]